ncbi:P-loop containing nucleoside triphosphate hydrolase protein, partial [Baffinella frigidus]
DAAFDEKVSNRRVYQATAQPLVDFVMRQGMATCFAFGQTGSGKTYTMLGSPCGTEPGLFSLAAQDLFRIAAGHEKVLEVWVSMMEIYGDEVLDLLDPLKAKLIPREDAHRKVQIQGLTNTRVHSVEGMLAAVEGGSALRCTSTTGMNEVSSRSHAIIQVQVKTTRGTLYGQLSFIDLAGSEKGCDTAENEKRTRIEGAEINKSLLALKECIRAMNDPQSAFTPFRGSKLTLVLRESFIGDGRTVMIANVSPHAGSCVETVNTLRYADRVK